MSAPPDGNFGHWLIDFLTRLIAREQWSGKTKIAVPDTLTSKQMETLALFGVFESDLIRCRLDTRYRFRSALVVQNACSMPPHPHHVTFLRKHLFAGARRDKKGDSTGSKRFHLSRAAAGTRDIANKQEYTSALEEYGAATIELSTLSIADQRLLFSDADMLISTLGTDMLALYFAPPSCTVIIVIDDASVDHAIGQTCAILGMPYQYLISPISGVSDGARHTRDVDFVVDCDELRTRLAALG